MRFKAGEIENRYNTYPQNNEHCLNCENNNSD